jgi:glutamyl/glutaminyl-tRNA synthetase
MNDSGICRPYGAGEFFMVAVSTKMSLLTELGLTGKTSGPSLYHLLQVLGKERVMARIEKALEKMLTMN